MNELKGFSARRCLLLIRNDLFLNRNYLVIFLAAAAGLLFILSGGRFFNGSAEVIAYPNFYGLILFILGLTITEKTFKDIHDDVKGPTWLTLPASNLEKFSSRLIFCTVVVAAGLMIFFFLISLLWEGIHYLLNESNPRLFNPFEGKALSITYIYIIIQSLLMLGAIYFKKSPGIKTILSIVVYVLVFTILVAVAIKIFFGGSFWNLLFGRNIMNVPELAARNDIPIKIWSMITFSVRLIFQYLFAPLCWVIGYIRLKEKEI
jgi:hypothetical protein